MFPALVLINPGTANLSSVTTESVMMPAGATVAHVSITASAAWTGVYSRVELDVLIGGVWRQGIAVQEYGKGGGATKLDLPLHDITALRVRVIRDGGQRLGVVVTPGT
jgi:hypothetical protein